MKKLILLLLGLTFYTSTHAQRITLNEMLNMYKIAIIPNQTNAVLDNALKGYSGNNWLGPFQSKHDTEIHLNWAYKPGQATLSTFTILRDVNPIFPIRIIFRFPYNAQYRDYLSDVVKIAELANEFNDKGKLTKVYETQHLVIALAVYPAELQKYFEEGVPAPYYEIFLQAKK